MKKNNIFYLFMLLVLTGLSSCEKDDELYPQLGEDPRSLSQVIEETPELTSFSQALTQVGLDSVLRNTTTFTVFAPSNAAFEGVDLSALSETELETLLLNHIVNTTTADFSSNLVTGYFPTMAATGPNGEFLDAFISNSGTVTVNGTASFVDGSFDIGTTNGVLHVVDNVIPFPDVAEHIEINPDFSMLAEAIELADLSEILAVSGVTDPENANYPITLFAPTNAAFEGLISRLNDAFGWETLEDIPSDVLQEILMYHLVTGENILAETVANTEQTTLQGGTFSIDASSAIADASYSTANFVLTDIQGTNGVIHAIDKVLLTENVFQDILDVTQNLGERLEDRGYSTFLAAAQKVGLFDSLESDQFTVFAPNNSAFDSFFGKIENFESLDDFDTEEELELLRNILEYHLYSGLLITSQMKNGPLETVAGDEITVDLTTGSLIPSHEHAPNANFVTSNIGAANGVIHEISNVLVPAEVAEALGYPVPSTGGPEYGFEIYHDELNADFWFGWTNPDFANTENVFSGDQSIRLDYAGWEALQVGMDAAVAEELVPYTTLDFAVYSETGVEVLVALNGQDASGEIINIPAGEWTQYSIPLANIANGATHLNQLVFQVRTPDAGTLFFDQIGLDVIGGGNAAPEFELPIFYDSLESGFQQWDGWGADFTWNSTEVVQNGETAIKVSYFANGWGALQIGGPGDVTATDYATFNFSAYGAEGTGTTPLLVGLAGTDDGVEVQVVEGEWTSYSIPVSSFPDTSLGEIRIKNNSAEAGSIYFDNIGFSN